MYSGGHCLISALHSWPDWAGGRAPGAPGMSRDNAVRLCSDATGRPAAVGAASQAVPVCAALVASAAAVLVVRHWMSERNRDYCGVLF